MSQALHPSAGGHAGEPHVTPLKYYYAVGGALFFLTAVTVAVSELHLPMPYSIIVAMIVACIKAGLVVTIFMHLAWDKKLNSLVFFAGCVFMLIFFTLTMVDLKSRDWVNKEAGSDYMWREQMAAGKLPPGWHVANPDAAAHGDHEAAGQEAAPAQH